MQSLRGLAELSELAPLPEILDGIELAVGDLTRLFAPPPGVDEVMAAASIALTRHLPRHRRARAARIPRRRRRRRFTDLLLRAFAVERDVVPIESLYYDGRPRAAHPAAGQPQFEAPGAARPARAGEPRRAPLPDRRSHRRRPARPPSATSGSTISSARSAPPARPAPIRSPGRSRCSPARPGRRWRPGSLRSRSTDELVGGLRAAGELLRSVADAGDRMQVSRRILDVAHRLDRARTRPERARCRAQRRAGAESDVVPIESLAPDTVAAEDSDVVPIESLAPDPEPGAGGQLPRPGAAAAGARRPREPSTRGADRPVRAEAVAVAIESLCYRGRSALSARPPLRGEIAAALAGGSDLAAIRPLLQELLDLVPLALDES